MIDADPTLVAFMEGGSGNRALRFDLVTLTLASGTVLRYTNCDVPITTPDARTFAVGPLLERSKLAFFRGVEVDEMQLTLTPRGALDSVGGVPLLQLARLGELRGCVALLEWAYYDTSLVFKGLLPKFEGAGSPTGFENGEIEMTFKSELERLVTQMPQDVYQAPCANTVYDSRCGASRAAKTVSSTVTAAAAGARSAFTASALTQAAGYFELGAVLFTGGANVGVKRTVRSFGGGNISFALPLPFPIAVGDTFQAWPGCDGTMSGANGCPKFFSTADVRLHFRGTPYVPAPEVAT